MFDFHTIKDFDGHISKSIIGYQNLIDLLIPLSTNYITDGSTVLDLGCSTGFLLKQLSYRYSHLPKTRFIGIDTAIDNLANQDDVAPLPTDERVQLLGLDLTEDGLKLEPSKFITALFTFQFLAPEERQKLFRKVNKALLPGGAFVIAEKVYLNGGRLQDHFTFAHYDLKALNFKPKEILEKQRDIRYIMKPQSEEQIQRELHQNFLGLESYRTEMSLFWASYQFRAWIVTR